MKFDVHIKLVCFLVAVFSWQLILRIIFRHIKSVLHFFKKNPEGFIMLPFAVKFTYNIK